VLADGAISYELLLACLKGVRERGGRERERERKKRERETEKRERELTVSTSICNTTSLF
jgi:hypothetical protein